MEIFKYEKANKKSKNILSYTAIFDVAKDGGYNVSSPAFHGCVTFGKTFEEAKKYAKEVLELWIEESNDAKQDMPVFYSRSMIGEIEVAAPKKARAK